MKRKAAKCAAPRMIEFDRVVDTLSGMANVACRVDEFAFPLSDLATFINDCGDGTDHTEAIMALTPICVRMCNRMDEKRKES